MCANLFELYDDIDVTTLCDDIVWRHWCEEHDICIVLIQGAGGWFVPLQTTQAEVAVLYTEGTYENIDNSSFFYLSTIFFQFI